VLWHNKNVDEISALIPGFSYSFKD